MSTPIPKLLKNAIYELYFDEIECGPLDGGCWAFANAAKKVYGGSLYTLVGARVGSTTEPIAQHVVLYQNERFFDADGWSTQAELLKRWRRRERIGNLTLRPFQESDVPESPRIQSLVNRTAALLKKNAKDALPL